MRKDRIEKMAITNENQNLDKVVVMLAIPTILEQLSHIVVQYVDAAMVGSLGAYATAAVGINSSTMVLLGGLQQAVGVGFCVQVAQAIGAGKKENVVKITQQAILSALVLGMVLSFGMQVIGNYSPIWLGAEPEVIPSAVWYIRIVAGASVFQTLSITAAGLLRGAGETQIPFYVNLVANIANAIGNFLLIPKTRMVTIFGYTFEMWGVDLKVSGAAIATAGSMVISGIGLLAYLYFAETPVKVKWKGLFRFDGDILRPTAKVGIPIAMERFVLAAGQVALTAMVAHLGTAAVATHYIINTVATISYETSMGFSSAGTTLVAQCVGAKKDALAYKYTKICLRIGILISSVFSMVIIVFSPTFVGFFTSEASIIPTGVFLTRMDAVSEPLFGVSTVLNGIFRGHGDTKYPFVVTFIGILITRLSLGLLFAYVFGWGLIGIWIAIFVDIVLRAVMCLFHMRKYRVVV